VVHFHSGKRFDRKVSRHAWKFQQPNAFKRYEGFIAKNIIAYAELVIRYVILVFDWACVILILTWELYDG
jgi:hypothetical protein